MSVRRSSPTISAENGSVARLHRDDSGTIDDMRIRHHRAIRVVDPPAAGAQAAATVDHALHEHHARFDDLRKLTL